MFINDVVEYIWRSDSEIYKSYFENALKMSDGEIFESLKNVCMPNYQTDIGNLCNLVTGGCSYHIRGGKLSGCSMCNLHNTPHSIAAMMAVLKLRNKGLYSNIVRKTFENTRGIVRSRTVHEYVFSHNFLNPDEITDDCLNELFGEDGVFQKRPLIYEFETSAASVTPQRLKTLKKYVGSSGIWIRIGVECGNEWIRKYWLNKDISNEQIASAIAYCHEENFRITGNILLGIPGLTERQSIDVFCDTVEWLSRTGMDMYSCSVLDRKSQTLQGFIYENIRNNEFLEETGLAYGEHTGVPWLFSLLEAVSICENNISGFGNRITFGQFEPSYINGRHQMAYNHDKDCSCNKAILDFIRKHASQKNISCTDLYKALKENDKCYRHYMEVLERQKRAGNIKDVLKVTSKEISKTIWEDWQPKHSEFMDQLESFDC